jgi:hypothetical protein
MRDTKPPKATDRGTAYRNAAGTPTHTAPILTELAGAALKLLAGKGERGPTGRTLGVSAASGARLELRCDGPDVPGAIPDKTAHPSTIPKQRPWVGAYRLTVKAPLLVLDLYWNAAVPMRIMQFSRGDWEDTLRALARAA